MNAAWIYRAPPVGQMLETALALRALRTSIPSIVRASVEAPPEIVVRLELPDDIEAPATGEVPRLDSAELVQRMIF